MTKLINLRAKDVDFLKMHLTVRFGRKEVPAQQNILPVVLETRNFRPS